MGLNLSTTIVPMSEQIAIRPAVTDDISTLLEFEQRLIDYERPHTTSLQSGPISYYDLSQLIEAEDSQVLVAHIGPRLIGCGYAQIRESKWYYKHIKHSYLGFMFVDSDYRGRGINKRIMDGLKQWSYAKDIKEMRLSVFDSNQSAVRAYQKVGFAPDLLEMVLELDDPPQ